MAGKVKILFTDNTWVEFDKPEGFELMPYIHGMRSIGMVIANNFYCRADLIKSVFIQNDDEAQTFRFTSAPTPATPGTETVN